jgi:hypothetical protein
MNAMDFVSMGRSFTGLRIQRKGHIVAQSISSLMAGSSAPFAPINFQNMQPRRTCETGGALSRLS